MHYFNTHHSVSGFSLSGPDFLNRKDAITSALMDQIAHGDLDRMARIRASKRSL